MEPMKPSTVTSHVLPQNGKSARSSIISTDGPLSLISFHFSSLPSIYLFHCFFCSSLLTSLHTHSGNHADGIQLSCTKLSRTYMGSRQVSPKLISLPSSLTSSPEYYVKRNDARCKTGPNAALLQERYVSRHSIF